MSSALRLSIIMVLLLATTAFGLIAYNMNLPKQVPVPVAVTETGPVHPTTPAPQGLGMVNDWVIKENVASADGPRGIMSLLKPG